MRAKEELPECPYCNSSISYRRKMETADFATLKESMEIQ